MPWNSASPSGTLSVRANRTPMNQNTTYIETNMGNVGLNVAATNLIKDHFWNVGDALAGRHRYINMPKFTVGGNAADPLVGSQMNGVIYLKEVLGRVQGFYKNESGGVNLGIYQFIPAFIVGTVKIEDSTTFVTVDNVPANVYGDIYLWKIVNNGTPANSSAKIQSGSFVSNNNAVEAFSNRNKQRNTSNDYFIELGNLAAVDLNIKARLGNGEAGIWNYRITYRAQ